MNERNYQLAKQAGLYHKTTLIESAVPLDQMLDKFVELVVKECLSQVDKIRDRLEADGEDQQALGADWAGLAISRHFGVE